MDALQGRLGDGVLANLIQYLSLNRASGCLQVADDEAGRGRVFLMLGRVEHVEVGDLEGVTALAVLLGWHEGRFSFRVGVEARRRTIDVPVDALLLQASVGRDVDSALVSAVHGANGVEGATRLVDPMVASGLVWAAMAVAGPIGEIFVDEGFDSIGHNPRLLPEMALGSLVEAVAGRFNTHDRRQQFLARAEAVLAHHGYGRAEEDAR